MKTKFITDITDDPAVRQANEALAAARHRLEDARRERVAAETELADVEREAATGSRNEKQLRNARDRVNNSESEVRIAQQGVLAAEESAREVRDERLITLEAEMRAAYDKEMRALRDALVVARQHSHAMFELEEVSSRLFSGGPGYRKHDGLPGRPLPHASWSREFGSARANATDTRFGYWLKHHGLDE